MYYICDPEVTGYVTLFLIELVTIVTDRGHCYDCNISITSATDHAFSAWLMKEIQARTNTSECIKGSSYILKD